MTAIAAPKLGYFFIGEVDTTRFPGQEGGNA